MPATFRKLVIAMATVSQSRERQWGRRKLDGAGAAAVGDGVGVVSASASEPAYSSLRLLVPTTAATTAILTVMATPLTRTAMAIPTAMAIRTVTDIAALIITAATILAIGTRVITPIVGPTTGTDRPMNSRRRNGRA
jgi:hypothetical protein